MENIRLKMIQAIRLAQAERRWRSGSAARHLLKRKVRGNLRIDATLEDYDRVIQAVLLDPGGRVYAYWHQGTPYATVVSASDDDLWLVMIDLDGWMESAYVVRGRSATSTNRSLSFLGLLGELQ